MYAAYAQEEVISRLQLAGPTCFASSSNTQKLYVGTKQGHLLCVNHIPTDKRGFTSLLHRSFEKKAITDLQMIETHGLLLCLTDQILNVHETNETFKLISTFNKFRPIHSFVTYVQQPDNRLFVLLSVKRRLYLLKWLHDKFEEVQVGFNPNYLGDNASLLTWCGTHSLIFAIRNEYNYVRIFDDESSASSDSNDESGVIRQLFITPDTPLIVSIRDRGWIGLSKSNTIHFFNDCGNQLPNVLGCRFSETPTVLAYDAPHLIAILPKGLVEIRSIAPDGLIQRLNFNKATFLHVAAPGYVFIANESTIAKLNSRPQAKANVRCLIDERHFELAIALAENTPNFDVKEMIALKRKAANQMFLQRDYARCFNTHLEPAVGTDVLLVLNFIPKLIPQKYIRRLSDYPPEELADFEVVHLDKPFTENELKLAIAALGDYLSAKRTEFAQKLEQHQRAKREQRKDQMLKSRELQRVHEGLELVDSALLKCYLKTKPILVSSLLRLSDNSCLLAEAEHDLKEMNRIQELFILYSRKEQRRKALQLLKDQAQIPGSPLEGYEHTVDYLQTLKSDDLNLVFEYAKGVLAADFKLGTQIFCAADNENVQTWDPEEVLTFLKREAIGALIPYLEYLINEVGEKKSQFHETLVEQYIIRVKPLMSNYSITKAGDEDGELGKLRGKLLKFLQTSIGYNPQKILLLLDDYLIEEKAIVFGRLKRHEEALLIYTNVLMDFDAAERYCVEHYNPKDATNSQVFFLLYKAYISPTDLPVEALKSTLKNRKPTRNVNEALKILKYHSIKLDTVQAIAHIPIDTPLNRVYGALESVLESTKNKVSATGVRLAISNVAKVHAIRQIENIKSTRVTIDFNVDCVLCQKRITTSAFVRYTNGNIAHFFCHQKSSSFG
ncbi:Vam6/Vps39-like protein [Aphelenchoides besseyi]|nr:Vam6/Vps39-like protein [Aphelenchoides besseyi]